MRYKTIRCRECGGTIRGDGNQSFDRLAESLGWVKSGNGYLCPECAGGDLQVDSISREDEDALIE